MSKIKEKDLYHNSEDEIDLKIVFIDSIKLIKKRIIILIIFSALGLIGGYFSYLYKTKIFHSSMTISSTILTAVNTTHIIESLQLLIDEGNYDMLSKKLNIPIAQISQVKQVSVNFEKDINATEQFNIFDIEVFVTNNNILDTLQYSIIHFLEINEFVRRRVELKKTSLQQLITKIQNEITEIESLKEHVTSVSPGEKINVVVMNPVEIFLEGVNLYQKQLELQTELSLAENFQIIDGFTAYSNPASPKISRIFYGLLIGIFVGLIVVLIIELFSFYKKNA